MRKFLCNAHFFYEIWTILCYLKCPSIKYLHYVIFILSWTIFYSFFTVSRWKQETCFKYNKECKGHENSHVNNAGDTLYFRDRFRTAINVLGDSYGAGLVAHLSRNDLAELDKINKHITNGYLPENEKESFENQAFTKM